MCHTWRGSLWETCGRGPGTSRSLSLPRSLARAPSLPLSPSLARSLSLPLSLAIPHLLGAPRPAAAVLRSGVEGAERGGQEFARNVVQRHRARVPNLPCKCVVVTEAGSYLRLIDSCITQLKAQGPSRTCNESKEEELARIVVHRHRARLLNLPMSTT